MRRFTRISAAVITPAALAASLMLSSCFTGIEGTRPITLSKEERQLAERTAEEKLLDNVRGDSLSSWSVGRPFIVADARASVLLVPSAGSTPVADIVGDTVYYAGSYEERGLSGENEVNLLFTRKRCSDGNPSDDRYVYNVRQAMGRGRDDAGGGVVSNRIPMLIDVGTVEKISRALSGKRVYLLSADWTGEEGERYKGRKYVEARIIEVTPGNMVFPMRVDFECVMPEWAPSGTPRRGSYMMNYSDDNGGSRTFATLFSLSDPRRRYPQISDSMWVSVCDSRVARGMTKEECRLALGSPSDVDSGRDYSRTLDIWQYPDGTVLFFEDGLLTDSRVRGD